jgi:hypothetical protein
MSLDGTDAIAFNSSTVLWDYTVPHTLDLWINLDTYSGNQWPAIANFTTNESSNSFAVYLSNVTDYYGTNYAGINFSNNGINNFQTSSDVSAQFIGAWNHIVLVYDGVSPSVASSYTLYLNGVSQSFSDKGALWLTTSNYNGLGTDTAGGDYVNGDLDEVRISTIARSAGWTNFEYHNMADSGNDLTFNTAEKAIVWTGAASTSWSNASNWSPNSVPGVNDIALFNSNAPGTNNLCSIDDTVSVLGVIIDSSYTGTITDGYYNLSIGSSGWTQAGGTFNGSPGSNHVSFYGPFVLNGGTFNAGTYSFDGNGNGAYLSFNNQSASFTINGGTFNQQGAALGSNGSNDIGIDGYGMLNFSMTGGAFNGSSNVHAFIQVNGNGSSLPENGNFDLSGGTFTSTAGTLYVCDNFNVSSGATFAANGGTVALGGFFNTPRESTFSGSPTLNNFTFGGESWNTLALVDSAAPVINGTLTLAGSSVGRINAIHLGTLVANGNVIQTYNGIDGTTSINIGGTVAQTVTCSTGMLPPVHITNTNSAVSFVNGGLSYCEGLAIDPGVHVNFAAGYLYEFSNVDWHGTQANPIVLRSSSTGTQWNLLTEGAVVSYVEVKDSDARAGLPVLALNSIDSGNNLNWWFDEAAHVQIDTANSSRTSPAWVEGVCGGDVTVLTVSVNYGTLFNANRLNVQQWFTSNSNSGFGINLSSTSTTHVAVTATDGTTSNTVSQDITWTATDLSGKYSSSDIFKIRANDSLLLTASGTGSTLTIDPLGDGTTILTGTPGQTFPFQYSVAGTYTATASIDGGAVGTLLVIVIGVDLSKPIACEVNFKREKDVPISPSGEEADVSFYASNNFLLGVSTKGLFSYVDLARIDPIVEGTTLYLKALARGKPSLIARVGGASGPIVAAKAIDTFTIDSHATVDALVNDSTHIGKSKFIIRPYIPDLRVQFDMFAHSSTFENGLASISVSTSDSDFSPVFDSGTGEAIGVWLFELQVPSGEDSYCFTSQLFQSASPEKEISDPHNHNGHTCKAKVKEIIIPQGATDVDFVITRTVSAVNGEKHNVIILNDAGDPEPVFTETPELKFDCSGEINVDITKKVSAVNSPIGAYTVMIGDTQFPAAITVGAVKIGAPVRRADIDPFSVPFNGQRDINVSISASITNGAQGELSFEPSGQSEVKFLDGGVEKDTLPITQAGTDIPVTLTGKAQTAVADAKHLHVVAKFGGPAVGRSAGFSVCAHPFAVENSNPVAVDAGVNRGMKVTILIKSDSGTDGDLDQVQDAEAVGEAINQQGSFIGVKIPDKTSGFQTATMVPPDKHTLDRDDAVTLANNAAAENPAVLTGSFEKKQLDIFFCKRCGMVESKPAVVTRSGYLITRILTHAAAPATDVTLTTTKVSAPVQVGKYSATAGPSPGDGDPSLTITVTLQPEE